MTTMDGCFHASRYLWNIRIVLISIEILSIRIEIPHISIGIHTTHIGILLIIIETLSISTGTLSLRQVSYILKEHRDVINNKFYSTLNVTVYSSTFNVWFAPPNTLPSKIYSPLLCRRMGVYHILHVNHDILTNWNSYTNVYTIIPKRIPTDIKLSAHNVFLE